MGLARSKKTKEEKLIALDLGSTTARMIQMSGTSGGLEIAAFAAAPMPFDAFSGVSPVKPEKIAEIISLLLDKSGVLEREAAIALPSPAVFTKRITVPALDLKDLADHIQLEAGNFIPHPLEAVKLDFHIIGSTGKNQLDVLVAAVKKDIVEKYIDCLELAGLEIAVIDVDCFALGNAFESACPEFFNKLTALVHVGGRFTSFNVCSGGVPLFTGDISLGGKHVTDSISSALGLEFAEAERVKRNDLENDTASPAALAAAKAVDHLVIELKRQLSFFGASAGEEREISHIKLSGGGAKTAGLAEALSEKLGLPCSDWQPLRNIKLSDGLSASIVKEHGPALALAVGLGMRGRGDRIVPEY